MSLITNALPLTEDYFFYDKREGWNMAVERDWHMLRPLSLEGLIEPLFMRLGSFSANIGPVNSPKIKYGINIFYKLVVPLYLCENNGLTIDTTTQYVFDNIEIFDNTSDIWKFASTFKNCPLGSAGCPDSNRSDLVKSGLLRTVRLTSPYTEAYQLPPWNKLNETLLIHENFAYGEELQYAATKRDYEFEPYTKIIMPAILDKNNSNDLKYLLLNTTTIEKTDHSISYTVDASPNGLNIPNPSITPKEGYGYFMPEVFHSFGMVSRPNNSNPIIDGDASKIGIEGVNAAALANAEQFAWYYCVLGVTQLD